MAEAFSVICLSMKGTRMKIYHKDMLIYYLGTQVDFYFTHHRNEKPTHQCKDLHYPFPRTSVHPIKVVEKEHWDLESCLNTVLKRCGHGWEPTLLFAVLWLGNFAATLTKLLKDPEQIPVVFSLAQLVLSALCVPLPSTGRTETDCVSKHHHPP